MEHRRIVRSIVPILLACAGCGGSEPRITDAASRLLAQELLAKRPALPTAYLTAAGQQPIDWDMESGDGPAEFRTCASGQGAFRAWSEGGVEWGAPGVDLAVCVFESDERASEVYSAQSLLEVGGEDWPNFEPSSDAEIVPTQRSSLNVLLADDWEIGCGIGDPDAGCAVWTFRARYGRVLSEVEFVASPGAIQFQQMGDLVVSVDREIDAGVRAARDGG